MASPEQPTQIPVEQAQEAAQHVEVHAVDPASVKALAAVATEGYGKEPVRREFNPDGSLKTNSDRAGGQWDGKPRY